jgi:shikimate 5-dehydrogenase
MIPSPERPTFYFIGVSTAGSLSLELFPVWLATLGLPPADIRGHDIPIRGPREAYREVVRHIRSEPNALGALVTTHKMDLVAAAGDLIDSLDPYAQVFREVSCLAKRDGGLRGWAKDPFSSGLALEHFLPPQYWQDHPQAQVLILGAGGAGIALSAYLMRAEHGPDLPARITISDIAARSLAACREIHGRLGRSVELRYEESAAQGANDRLLAELPAGSLVVNATGLGKDRPGSPLSPQALFPLEGYVWEFNYRGELEFLRQAERQRQSRRLTVEDGLVYFIFGWALGLGEVFGRQLSSEELGALCRATYAYLGNPPDRRPCD